MSTKAGQAQAEAETDTQAEGACPGKDEGPTSQDREEAGQRKVLRGRPIADLALGDTAELSRAASGGDVAEFLDSIGDRNPIHHDHEYAATTRFEKPIVPGMWTAGLVSAVLGTTLPGPGCIYISQQITFTKPVFFGDVITARAEVVERFVERNRVRLKTTCVNQDDELVMEGEALLLPPKAAVAYTRRKAGTAAVTHWSLQPAVWTAKAASSWARLGTSMLQVWQPKK